MVFLTLHDNQGRFLTKAHKTKGNMYLMNLNITEQCLLDENNDEEVGMAKDQSKLGEPDWIETTNPSKWAFDGLGPSLILSRARIWSWTKLKNKHPPNSINLFISSS